jgi:hypothetical protein
MALGYILLTCVPTPSGIVSSKYRDGDDSEVAPPSDPEIGQPNVLNDGAVDIPLVTASTGGTAPLVYELERSTTSALAGFAVVDANADFSGDGVYSQTGLTALTQYWWRLACVDADLRRSGYSAVFTATTAAAGGGDVTAPTAPTNLAATSTVAGQASLTWTNGTDAVGIAFTDVIRGNSVAGTPTNDGGVIYSVVGTGASYTDQTAPSGSEVFYRVQHRDAAGNVSAQTARCFVTITAASSDALPFPNNDGGPSWLHGYGQIGAAVNYQSWRAWIGHQTDVAVCWSTPATNWTAFRTGRADVGANFTAALAYLPITTLIVHAYPMFGKYNNTGAIGTTTGTNLSNKNNARPATWTEIAAGMYDAHYTAMATAMRTLIVNSGRDINTNGGNVVLRLGWEMNGDWYDHSICNSIEDFKLSWARIVGLIRAVIPTMKFDFSPARPWVGFTAGRNYVRPTSLLGFIPDPSTFDYITRSTHDVYTDVPGYGPTSTVDETTFNYKHVSPPNTPYDKRLSLTEMVTVANSLGKRYGISEWATQMGTQQTGELVQASAPEVFVAQVYNWLNANKAGLCWDAYLSSSNEALHTRPTSAAAIAYKDLWT